MNEPNPWEETVRAIFDATFFSEEAQYNEFAYSIRRMIEERHHDYFHERESEEEMIDTHAAIAEFEALAEVKGASGSHE